MAELDLAQLVAEIGEDEAVGLLVDQLGWDEDWATFLIALSQGKITGDVVAEGDKR